MAQFATLSSSQLATIKMARVHADKATRQQIKKDVFTCAKARFGLPVDMNLKVGMESGLIRTKGGDTFPLADDGKWTGMARPVPKKVVVQIDRGVALRILQDEVRDDCIDFDAITRQDASPDALLALDNGGIYMDDASVYLLMDADEVPAYED